MTGSPDIGGSCASMALMAAETLGIDYDQIRSIVADTSSVGYTLVTGGSRVTFATGMAIVEASKKIVDELRARAAMIWDVDVEGVVWEDGQAKPGSSNVGDFAPLPFRELAAKKAMAQNRRHYCSRASPDRPPRPHLQHRHPKSSPRGRATRRRSSCWPRQSPCRWQR